MKRKMLLIASLLISVTFTDCKKDKSDPPIVGLWVGKYGGSLTTYPTSGFTMLFRSNGTVRVFDGTDTSAAGKAEGTYTVSGTTVTTTYAYSASTSYATTATVDAKFTFQEGTWGPPGSASGSGRFFLNKK